jgi:hypothetical protein
VQSREAQQAIEKARQAQIACVEAFEAYAVAKLGKDKSVSLADKQAAVVSYVALLPALLEAVRALVGRADGVRSAERLPQLRLESWRSPRLQEVFSNLRPSAQPVRYTSPGEYRGEVSGRGDRVEVTHGN